LTGGAASFALADKRIGTRDSSFYFLAKKRKKKKKKPECERAHIALLDCLATVHKNEMKRRNRLELHLMTHHHMEAILNFTNSFLHGATLNGRILVLELLF